MEQNKKPGAGGFKRPPVAHQFLPGQSGNPSGRPKGVRSLKLDLRDELAELIAVSEGDRKHTLSKQRAIIKGLVTSALKGDSRSISTILTYCERAFSDAPGETLSAEDHELLEDYAMRMQLSTKPKATNPVNDSNKKE